MDDDMKKYIKAFCESTIQEQLVELDSHPVKALSAIEYMHKRLMCLGCMALSAGTPPFEDYKQKYSNILEELD